MEDLTNFYMILTLAIVEKDYRDKTLWLHKHFYHHNHLKFVKLSIYIPSKNIWRYVLIFRRVCLHRFSTIFSLAAFLQRLEDVTHGLWVFPGSCRNIWHCSNEFVTSFSLSKSTFFSWNYKNRHFDFLPGRRACLSALPTFFFLVSVTGVTQEADNWPRMVSGFV